jgi:predicted molibdopterin-dependent oxidoreductase YjgC
VVQDIFLTETAREADVVLPSTAFAEKNGTFVNTERKVQLVRKAIDPPGEAKEDWKIMTDLSARLGFSMDYSGLDEIMEEISRLTPSYRGINYRRLEEGGIPWPCPDTDHPGTPCLHIDRFTCGLGVFHAIDYIPPDEIPDADYPFYLTTGRVLYQYHTGTMTMKSTGLNNLAPGCFVEMAPGDADRFGIAEGEPVRVISRRGELTARAQVSEKAVEGTVFLPFHFADAAANLLTNSALDPVAKIPEFKVCAVRIEKNQAAGM